MKILAIWLCWLGAILGFQGLASSRVQLMAPDRAQNWTASETMPGSQDSKIYLNEPFLNNQVAWDSEFYISIATTGYDDKAVGFAQTPLGVLPLNYAFFPFYPMVMRVAAAPMQWFGMAPIAAASLAGVIVSAIGSLCACFALYVLSGGRPRFRKKANEYEADAVPDLERQESRGLRTVLYFLVFPTSFFLTQVYTEGLFCGLAFGALAFAKHRRLVPAAILAACAVWTRAVGIALLIPLAMAWWQSFNRDAFSFRRIWKEWRALLLLLPIAALVIWRGVLGTQFSAVEENFFGRGFLNIGSSLFGYGGWGEVLASFAGNNPHMIAHNLITLFCSLLALACALFALKTNRDIALFAIAAFAVAAFSGSAQSMSRYVLVLPTTYLVLARWGEVQVFDKVWLLVSVLLLGLLSMLFTANFWVA